MVTRRSLRRAHPERYRAGAAIVAATVGVATAAWGVMHVVQPYPGNGARSDARTAEETPVTPTELLLDAIVDVVSTVPPSDDAPGWLSGLDPLAPGSLVINVLGPGGQLGTVPGPGGGGGGGQVLPPVPPPSGIATLVSNVTGGGDGKGTGAPGGVTPPGGPGSIVCPAPITAPVTAAVPAAEPLAGTEQVVDQATGCPTEAGAPPADGEQGEEAEDGDGTVDRGTAFGNMA